MVELVKMAQEKLAVKIKIGKKAVHNLSSIINQVPIKIGQVSVFCKDERFYGKIEKIISNLDLANNLIKLIYK